MFKLDRRVYVNFGGINLAHFTAISFAVLPPLLDLLPPAVPAFAARTLFMCPLVDIVYFLFF